MEKLMHALKAPFKKGLLIGTLDTIFKAVALVLWLLTVRLVAAFVWDALFTEPVLRTTLWWLCYSAMIFTIVTLLAYNAILNRE